MHRLRDEGSCVIFISHDLEEVIEQSDNISVLRDGVYIGSVTKEEATPDRLKSLMVGREIGDNYYRTDYGEKISGEVVLSGRNLTVKGQIDNLSLELHKGKFLESADFPSAVCMKSERLYSALLISVREL